MIRDILKDFPELVSRFNRLSPRQQKASSPHGKPRLHAVNIFRKKAIRMSYWTFSPLRMQKLFKLLLKN